MASSLLPRAQASIVGPQGIPTREFYNFLLSLAEGTEDSALQAQILALAARVAALEAEEQSGASIQGPLSVSVTGSLSGGVVQISLEGDVYEPGLTFYYGTNAAAEKGWYAVADTVDAAAGELTKDVAIDGVTTFGLADVPDAGGGTLQKTEFDAKGRKTGTSAATTDDLPEGATNLYFSDERAQDAVVVQTITNGDTTHAPSGDAVFDALAGKEPAIAPGTTGQLWRGDKTWSNTITGSFSIDGNTGSPGMLPGLFGLYLAGPDNVPAFAHFDGFGQSGGLLFRAANGTNSAKTALIGSQLIGQFQGRGYDGAAYSAERVSIQYRASQAWTGAAQGTRIHFRTTANDTTTIVDRWLVENSGHLLPSADNAYALGGPLNRTSVVYSATGAINTSDAREKTIRGPLTEPELAAAQELAAAGVIYQWNHAIEKKGDAARWHFGPTVQDVIAIMESHGLDPFRYGFICYDQWDEVPEIVQDGEVVQPHRPAGDRYSLRHDQLALFIHTGAAQERAAMRERISRLEALIPPPADEAAPLPDS